MQEIRGLHAAHWHAAGIVSLTECMESAKAATFRPRYLQHAGSNYTQGTLRVAQGIYQRTRVVRKYQILGLFLVIQKLYEIRVSKDKLPDEKVLRNDCLC